MFVIMSTGICLKEVISSILYLMLSLNMSYVFFMLHRLICSGLVCIN